MKKLLLLLILGSLITGCETTGGQHSASINDKVKNIQLTVIYSGDLVGSNTGVKQKDGSYATKMLISSQATMAELLDAFHQQTGLAKTHTFWGGAPPNRRATEIPYDHIVNGQMVHDDNEDNKLSDWDIDNNATITIRIGGAVSGVPKVD